MNPLSIPALLRSDAVTLLTGFSSDELEREVNNGLFPPPVRLTPDDTSDAIGWSSCEIAAVNAAKIGGATCEQLRQLVGDLVAARTQLARPLPVEATSMHGVN